MPRPAHSESDLQPYVVAWQRRREERARQRRDLQQHTVDTLPALVRVLVEQYGARRVVLFGSLARGEFGPGSDVDLLVEGGLEGALLFRAGAQLEALLPPGVGLDLVPRESARPEIVERVEQEGRVLHVAP